MSESVPFQSSFFTVQRDGEVYIVSLDREQLRDDDNLEQFSQDLNLLIEKHEIQKFVLRMTRIQYMTSMAIGKIISLHRRLNRLEGRLVLCELKSDIAETLDAANLLNYFTTSADSGAAVALLRDAG